ncbi:hypothetical protein D3C80_1806330 [compost metagenome]
MVERQALPLRIGEARGGFGRALRLEQALALLIGAPPEVVKAEGVAALRHAEQQQRQAEQPAAASGAGGQQQ